MELKGNKQIISDSVIGEKQNNQTFENNIKAVDKNTRVDVSKMVEEYQQKFSVPKPLIIKWLNVQNQKSLFGAKKGGDNIPITVDSGKLSSTYSL